EHGNVSVAQRLFPGGRAAVAVGTDCHVDGFTLVDDGARERDGGGAREADVPGDAAGLDHRGYDDGGDHDGERARKPRPEGLRPAPFAYLAAGYQPALPHAVHAATAWRNSSDSVGGWEANEMMSARSRAALTTVARSLSQPTGSRAWPAADSTSSSGASLAQSGAWPR